MTVTDVHKDHETLTMTITAEFEAPIARVWEIWSNPRLLERWWGPPTYPATVVDHDLAPGGSVSYFMTGPEGEKHGGWWRMIAVDAPRSLEFEDGFADDNGAPNPEMPTTMIRVGLQDRAGGGTRMSIETTFPSVEAMEQMVAMGMEEGMQQAMSQIDGLLDD
jgi:uncharacterized protein YndB with AHSA1/START domain